MPDPASAGEGEQRLALNWIARTLPLISGERSERDVWSLELACTPTTPLFSFSFPSWTSWVRVPSPRSSKVVLVNELQAADHER
jgi:hypothetical protein